MKKNLSRAASLLCSLILLFTVNSNAQKKVINFWDFNQTRPFTGAGTDSLGTRYSYANPYVVFAGSQDSTENTMPLFANYSTNATNNPRIVVGGYPKGKSYLENGSGGSYYYDYSGSHYSYYHGSDSNGTGGNQYVRLINPAQLDTVYIYLPTVGYHNVWLDYSISASSTKGANYNIFSYSTNGGNTWNNLTKAMDTFNISGVYRPDTLQMINPTTAASKWYPININFTSDPTVSNNANFVVRWIYGGANVTLTSGNDRYDNFALVGDSLCPSISLQPMNYTVCGGGGNADFVIHTIGGTNVTYQWQVNTGHGFTNLSNAGVYSGVITDSLIITGATMSMTTYQYQCIVTNIGCGTVTSTVATLTIDPALRDSIASFTNVNCLGKGSATEGVKGGSSPYTYLWSDISHQTTATASNLSAGTYTVTVNDLAGCMGTSSVTIIQQGLVLTISNIKNVECTSFGSATATASNGTSPYTYLWSDLESSATATKLSAGTYTIVAADITGCSASTTVTISQINPVRDSINGYGIAKVIHYWDFNNTLPAGGGGGDSLGTVTYPLNAPFTLIPAGNPRIVYTHPSAIQTNPLVCTVVDGILDNVSPGAGVNDLPLLGNDTANLATNNLGVRARNPSENAYMYLYIPTTGYQDIQLNYALSASSSKGAFYNIFSYSTNGGNTWKNLTKAMDTFNIGGIYRPDTLQAINPTTAASLWYPVHVSFSTDPAVNNNPNFIVRWEYEGTGCNGTSGNDRYDNISVSGNIATETCNGAANYTAVAGVKYGQVPYTYNWTPNVSSSATASNLSAGTYTVNVTDANGCSMSSTITVTQPAILQTSVKATNVKCYDELDGSATASVAGGTSPYNYNWSNARTADTILNVGAGSFTVEVTDGYGCTSTASVSITQPTAMTATHDSIADNGNKTGVAAVTLSGGTGPYTYLWTPGGKTTDTIKGQSAGTYTCTILDANGCAYSTTVTIKSTAGVAGISNSTVINIYPDPNTGYFTVAGVLHGQTIELYNYTGQKLSSTFVSDNTSMQFNIADRANGIYLVRVLNQDGTIAKESKIVKIQ